MCEVRRNEVYSIFYQNYIEKVSFNRVSANRSLTYVSCFNRSFYRKRNMTHIFSMVFIFQAIEFRLSFILDYFASISRIIFAVIVDRSIRQY